MVELVSRMAAGDRSAARGRAGLHGADRSADGAECEALARGFAGTEAEPLARSVAVLAVLSGAGNPAFRYRSVYEFLLREGLGFDCKPLPPDVCAGAPGLCYANCRAIALRRRARYAYCEGIASADHGIPIQHAWLLDLVDGRAVDPTWRGEPTARAYIGVVVDPRYLAAAFRRSGCVLDDWRARRPILTGEAGDAWRHDWHRLQAARPVERCAAPQAAALAAVTRRRAEAPGRCGRARPRARG